MIGSFNWTYFDYRKIIVPVAYLSPKSIEFGITASRCLSFAGYVRVGYDPHHRVLGIVPTKAHDPLAFPVRLTKKNTLILDAEKIFQALGIEVREVAGDRKNFGVMSEWKSGMLIVHLQRRHGHD